MLRHTSPDQCPENEDPKNEYLRPKCLQIPLVTLVRVELHS